jgi:hypothetical protein
MRKGKALYFKVSPELSAPIIKELMKSPDVSIEFKEWLSKKIAKECGIRKRN